MTPGRAEAGEEGADAFALSAERQRASAAERAQENLQAAVATDVVEGRPLLQRRVGDRARQRSQSVRRRAWAGRSCRRSARSIRFLSRAARGAAAAAAAGGRARRLRRESPGVGFVAVIDQRVGVARRAQPIQLASAPIPAGRARSGARNRRDRSAPRRLWPCRRTQRTTERPSRRARCGTEARCPREIVEPQHMISRRDDPTETCVTFENTRDEARYIRQEASRRAQGDPRACVGM